MEKLNSNKILKREKKNKAKKQQKYKHVQTIWFGYY